MLFTEPLPFQKALESARVKALLPTRLTSEQLKQIPAAIRERSLFSARVANTDFLDELQDTIGEILEPFKGKRGAIEGLGIPEARLRLTEVLDRFNYIPSAPETITDLSSDQRLNLILETQTKMAHGYGQWAEGQDQIILDAWPAAELYRGEDRKEPRDWPTRWQEAGGTLYAGGGDYPEGRMIALKNDPIWEEISAFGLPYPPFDFNSGMDVRDIPRREAEQLGILSADEAPEPEERDFAKDLEASADFAPKLLKQLLRDVGPDFKVRKGVLVANETRLEIIGELPKQNQPRAIMGGLLFRIENPKGTVRTGTNKAGKSWAVVMPADYGYVSDTEGADGDEVDAFLGDKTWSSRVWVADMVDPATGRWDEHKAFVGFADEKEVRDVLREAYDDGAKDRVQGLTAMGLDQFHLWLRKGKTVESLTNDCGTGAGGFKPGNKCAAGGGLRGPSEGGKTALDDPEDAPILGRAALIHGYPATSVIRQAGKEGIPFDKVRKFLDVNGVVISDATIRTQLHAGRAGLRGPGAPLTEDQLRQVRESAVLPPEHLTQPPVKEPKPEPPKPEPPEGAGPTPPQPPGPAGPQPPRPIKTLPPKVLRKLPGTGPTRK